MAVERVHAIQLALLQRPEELAESQDAGRLVAEARALRVPRGAVLQFTLPAGRDETAPPTDPVPEA